MSRASIAVGLFLCCAFDAWAACPVGFNEDIYTHQCVEPVPGAGPGGAIPNAVAPKWDAIALAPSRHVAAYAGSFTMAENAKKAAMKGCAEYASDCRIVSVSHDTCVAIAYEKKADPAYRVATAATRSDAQGRALPVCMAQGPQRCAVLSRCSDTPPTLAVQK